MGRLQDVTRFLLAAGGSASADGKSTHLFHEEKNALFMETWTGSELTNRQQVVTGVRTDTAAPLVSLHYNRVFVVDQTHALRCFTETEKAENEHDSDDEEEEEDTVWEDEELDGLDIKVHDKSQLAVACGKITIVVFYQNADGTIGAIEDDGHHGWKIAQLPHSEALPGTPMASFQAKDAVYFVYVAADQTFRYLEHSNDEWKDAPFSSAKIEGATAKISLAEDEKAETDPKLLIFCLADNKLSTIKPGSTEAETWGTVEDGVYKPTSDQENNGSPQGSIPIPFHPGSLFIYSSGPPPPPPPPVVPAFFPVASPFACYEDFGQLSLRDDAQYQQPLYRPQPPPPYEYAYGRFNDRYYESQDEPMLRQSTQRPDARSGPQPHYDPSWQGSYQHPYRARDMYQQDPYQRDPYYQDRYPQDYYQRDPYQRDPNQPPPQDFSRQQNLPQELQRQQQGPLQESSRQQQQQQPPLQELQRRQQPPLQETQRQQQPPVQEIQRRQEPVHRAPTVEDGEEEDDDDDSPPQSQPPPPPPPQPQPQTQRQPAPVPNAEETQQRRQQQQQQQQPQQHLPPSPTIKTEDDPEAFRRHRPLMQDRHARGIWPEETVGLRQSGARRLTSPDSAFDEDEDEFLQHFRRYRREALERDRQDELRRAARQELLERDRQEEELRRARQEELRLARQEEGFRRAHQEEHSRARRPPPQHRGFDYEPHHPYLTHGHGLDDHRSPFRGGHRSRPDPIIKFRTYHYITSMRCERCHRRYKKMGRGLPFARSHEWVKKCRC